MAARWWGAAMGVVSGLIVSVAALAAETPQQAALRASALQMKAAHDPCTRAAHWVSSISMAAEAGKASPSAVMKALQDAQTTCAKASQDVASLRNPLTGTEGLLWKAAIAKCAAGPRMISDGYGAYLRPGGGNIPVLAATIDRAAELQKDCGVRFQQLAIRLMP